MNIGTDATLHTVNVFVMMGAAGIAIGLLFDIFRAFHISFKAAGSKFDKISVQVTDAIFVLSAFCIFTFGIYIFNSGEIRSYCVLGTAAGICAYFLALAPFINRLLRFIFGITYHVISAPVKLVGNVIKKLTAKKQKAAEHKEA